MRRERSFAIVSTVAFACTGLALGASCSEESAAPGSTTVTIATDTSYYTGDDGGVYEWNDAAGPCQPAPTDEFAPVPIAPVVNAACTDEQIASYVAQCLDPSLTDITACQAWKAVPENEACRTSCPMSTFVAPDPATSNPPPTPVGPWGPVVRIANPGTIGFFNIGACVAVMDPSASGQACADALNTQLQCEYYACAANCSIPTSDTASADEIAVAQMAYIYCTYAADSGPCASYVDAVTDCVAALPVDAPELFCVDGTLMSGDPGSFNPAAETFLTAQCGGAPPPDGGAGGTGGSGGTGGTGGSGGTGGTGGSGGTGGTGGSGGTAGGGGA